ncbi:hypothetical protein [Aurantiacibacter sediminis]|uniref:HEPN domain-containing protein n=1 Tax=Aurantiacibacter sediminis TaxID=2793064 RepID=A0ABS0N165_9SPHN|nr:hypothetical protein [Aurantiacibacter sediminis]MBH5321705.1 hypothetical protein [Aurantiacibacter sediminis]
MPTYNLKQKLENNAEEAEKTLSFARHNEQHYKQDQDKTAADSKFPAHSLLSLHFLASTALSGVRAVCDALLDFAFRCIRSNEESSAKCCGQSAEPSHQRRLFPIHAADQSSNRRFGGKQYSKAEK